jgi:hypothetical protein
MASATFRVTSPEAARVAADPGVAMVAARVMADVVARTPVGATGDLAAGWQMEKLREGARRITNPVRYAKDVEFGTRYMAAEPMVGPVLAAYR